MVWTLVNLTFSRWHLVIIKADVRYRTIPVISRGLIQLRKGFWDVYTKEIRISGGGGLLWGGANNGIFV